MNEIDFMQIGELFADRPLIICLFIFLFTFVLEDVATVSAALLASYGYIEPQNAYVCLVAGIILGDFGLYGLGYGASRFKWADKILKKRKVIMAQNWLDQREILAVIAARFVPGARLPTYTAMGFFKLSFPKFMMTVFIASVIWTSLLFIAIFQVGEVFVTQLDEWRIPMALMMIAAVIILPRIISHFIKRRQSA